MDLDLKRIKALDGVTAILVRSSAETEGDISQELVIKVNFPLDGPDGGKHRKKADAVIETAEDVISGGDYFDRVTIEQVLWSRERELQ
ncbi:hypothetical protein [Nisaea sp.]|uniref:hypothetical protein n=1 Tax=Nisaea sp. TaxID=2024842 RepID=UPI003263534A